MSTRELTTKHLNHVHRTKLVLVDMIERSSIEPENRCLWIGRLYIPLSVLCCDAEYGYMAVARPPSTCRQNERKRW